MIQSRVSPPPGCTTSDMLNSEQAKQASKRGGDDVLCADDPEEKILP